MITDKLNRRWIKANRKTKGGGSARSKYYADHQQRRLLAREKGMIYKLLTPFGHFLKVTDLDSNAPEDFEYDDAEFPTCAEAEAALEEINRPGTIVVGVCEDGVVDRLGN